jgi:hypothetical protein
MKSIRNCNILDKKSLNRLYFVQFKAPQPPNVFTKMSLQSCLTINFFVNPLGS